MSIFSRISLAIIITISTSALAMGDPDYSHPSHYPSYKPHKQSGLSDRSDHHGGPKLEVLKYKRPTNVVPDDATPAYIPPADTPPEYAPPAVYTRPTHYTPTLPIPPVAGLPHDIPDMASNPPVAYTSAYRPPAAPAAYTRPPYYPPTVETPAYTPEYIPTYTPEYTPTYTSEYTPAYTSEYTPTYTEYTSTYTSEYTPTYTEYTSTYTSEYTPTYAEYTPAYTSEYTLTSSSEETPVYTSELTATYTPELTVKYEPAPPSWGHGKPSPLPNTYDRRNVPRVARSKIGKNAKAVLPRQGHTRRFPFLKKRQQAGQHAIVPVTVNMISAGGHASSTSGALATSTTSILPVSASPFAPRIKVDTPQDTLSLHGSSEATMPSAETFTPPVSSDSGGQQHGNLDTGGPGLHRDKVATVASVLSIIVGLIVFATIVKLTSNAMRRRKHPVGLGKYEEHLNGSKEGLIPELGDKANFETHDVIITRPDGSKISPLSPTRGNSPPPPPFVRGALGTNPPPLPMPTFALPPVPASPLAMPYAKLLSPTVNLAQQNLVQNRVSAASETMSMSTTTSDISERRSASDSEGMGRHLSHRRMRSAPGSVVWSARSSGATGKFMSGTSGEEGYWESVDVCGSESVSRMAYRSSRGRSVGMSVMW